MNGNQVAILQFPASSRGRAFFGDNCGLPAEEINKIAGLV
jgi:hypothetical protein